MYARRMHLNPENFGLLFYIVLHVLNAFYMISQFLENVGLSVCFSKCHKY